MTALRALPGGVAGLAGDGFEVGFITEDGVERRLLLTGAWAVPFERCRPVRRFASYKGQKHHSGRWWSATTGGHVGFESWLERDHLMLLDFDPSVVAVSSQPFWLFWTTPQGKTRSHAPDYFARRGDGSAVVVDCRPTDRIKPKDAAAFDATRTACVLVGWDYRLVDATDAIRSANVRWLAGYRHPRHQVEPVAAALRRAFAAPAPLMAGAEAVGHPLAVLPVLFHLLWRHDLDADLSTPLHPGTVVRAVVS
ncbi:TnsA-like heteromeric transposase endonuclease subunit [Micromonospora sp. ALFpr18c]|uniref:TnsA-like heteromeric transposase endonuclease subunit n=1 Tax=Micromonospora sp. ALFpr18c TaxID=1458665 RepID=UPI00124B5695|nr:TnsA-like heteromeric transposase endonuclease subunit [Micromonospora sp. ALFpr18c]KAB1941143.1 TnsA-like heteromeric transposase endonuclease subunit [Micromonospora sp. ALFpr18c]